jgi:hypothetical protein
MLSIAEVISTFQLSWLPRTVTIAVPVAVVVTGVGLSFALLSVAVKTSKPAGIPVVLSLQPTPISEIVPNIASARDTRIPDPPLTASSGETAQSLGTGLGPPFRRLTLLDDDLSEHEWMWGAVIWENSRRRESMREALPGI